MPLFGCSGEALLSHLQNNRMTIIIKGTYASDRPLTFQEINQNRIYVDADDTYLSTFNHQSVSACDPNSNYQCIPSYEMLPIYIDFGGVRLSSSSQDINSITSTLDANNFWNIASNQRQVYCSHTYATNPGLDTCRKDDGTVLYNDFMNGRGAIYPSNDIPNTSYKQVGLFIRRIVTGWGYNNNSITQNTSFDNNLIRGVNIITLVGLNPAPTPTDTNQIDMPGRNQWFPMLYVSDANEYLHKGNDYDPIVLEIRMNIKENLMAHSYTFTNQTGAVFKNSVIGFSDWNRNHADTTNNSSARMGGNVLSRARFFYPHMVSRLQINNTTSNASLSHYYALYLSNDTESTRSGSGLPLAATPARSGEQNFLNHIMPGNYILQCRHDTRNIGYPQSILNSREVSVPSTPSNMPISFQCP